VGLNPINAKKKVPVGAGTGVGSTAATAIIMTIATTAKPSHNLFPLNLDIAFLFSTGLDLFLSPALFFVAMNNQLPEYNIK